MEFLIIDQTDAESEATGHVLYVPLDRIVKVLKNDAPWGGETCMVKVFHEDDSGSDAAIVIVRGAATAEVGKTLGLVDKTPSSTARQDGSALLASPSEFPVKQPV